IDLDSFPTRRSSDLELKEKLGEIVKSDKRDQRKELKQLLNLLQLNHNQDKNWEDFRVVFERVHEHFFDGLKEHCSKLSSADLRLDRKSTRLNSSHVK